LTNGGLYCTSGWNLISGNDTVICNAHGPLYTLQSGDTTYEPVEPQSANGVTWATLQPGLGYWAYFDQPRDAPQTLGLQPGPAVAIPLPAGQYIMIADPFSAAATVSGADAVYVYDSFCGYVQTETLIIGRGALAYSAAGGTLTLDPSAPSVGVLGGPPPPPTTARAQEPAPSASPPAALPHGQHNPPGSPQAPPPPGACRPYEGAPPPTAPFLPLSPSPMPTSTPAAAPGR